MLFVKGVNHLIEKRYSLEDKSMLVHSKKAFLLWPETEYTRTLI